MSGRERIRPGENDIFTVVDVQYDFLPGGALAIPNGDAVIAPINRLAKALRHVFLTLDWHPKQLASVASADLTAVGVWLIGSVQIEAK